MPAVQLTDRLVASIPLQPGKQIEVRDADLAGFFVRVGSRSKTYMIQGDLRQDGSRQTIKVRIGQAGKISAREARSIAKRLSGEIQNGVDPRPKPEPVEAPQKSFRNPTLASAWESYRDSHMKRKRRSERTIESYGDHVERLMADWLNRPLKELGDDPAEVKEMHDRLTNANGPYMANLSMRIFRAIYTHARKTARSLPAENPVFAVDWNPERRRDTGMGIEDLPRWFDQLREIDNPLRRELHMLILLSGSRPDPIKKIRLEHIDFRKRMVFVPLPKGGELKAFSIPLSTQMLRSIARAMRFGRMMHPEQAQTWLFPADSKSGHIIEHKEERFVLSHWGNDLRQTYRTIGQLAGTNEIDIHLLMNHSLPGVNAGYITRSKLVHSHLRAAQQQISNAVFGSLENEASTSERWPWASAKALLRTEFPSRLDAERGKAGQRCCRNMAVFRSAIPEIGTASQMERINAYQNVGATV
jgi:integrase